MVTPTPSRGVVTPTLRAARAAARAPKRAGREAGAADARDDLGDERRDARDLGLGRLAAQAEAQRLARLARRQTEREQHRRRRERARRAGRARGDAHALEIERDGDELPRGVREPDVERARQAPRDDAVNARAGHRAGARREPIAQELDARRDDSTLGRREARRDAEADDPGDVLRAGAPLVLLMAAHDERR